MGCIVWLLGEACIEHQLDMEMLEKHEQTVAEDFKQGSELKQGEPSERDFGERLTRTLV